MPNLTADQSPFKIIGYVSSRAAIHAISAEKLTHINYAFAQVSEDSEVVLTNENSPRHLAQLQALKARNPSLKILLSVGGWGGDNFSDAALTAESRARLSRSSVELIKNYGLDGIDMDWEFPGQPSGGLKHRPEDKQNFTLMLADLREKVDALSDERGRVGTDRYTVTIASVDRDYFEFTEMDKVHPHLDWINIMSYDLYGSWNKSTGHHAGLFHPPAASGDRRSAADAVKQHLSVGIPANKIVMGAAFYGRGWNGVAPKNNGLFQPCEQYDGEYSYSTLVADYIGKNGFERHWDADAQAPYLWNPQSRTFIAYDDVESLAAKAQFVKEHNLAGMMYWEQSHDPSEVLLSAIYDGLNTKTTR